MAGIIAPPPGQFAASDAARAAGDTGTESADVTAVVGSVATQAALAALPPHDAEQVLRSV